MGDCSDTTTIWSQTTALLQHAALKHIHIPDMVLTNVAALTNNVFLLKE